MAMAKINENGDEWIVEPEPIVFPETAPQPTQVPEKEPVLIPVG